MSSECRLMASLRACQSCSPAEDLHTSQGEPSFCAYRAGSKQDFSIWNMCTWNVRTLLDVDGPVETAKLNSGVSVMDERKIDEVVNELDRYRVVVGALQEIRWFGREVYHVGESMVLTAGRDVPGGDEVRRRGEGVAIVLSGEAVRAWKHGGSRWKAWSSRPVSAILKVGNGSRDRLHIVSCYAPTFAASREDKNIFYATLQDALSTIPSDDCFVMPWDFNARVESRDVDDEWWHERVRRSQ